MSHYVVLHLLQSNGELMLVESVVQLKQPLQVYSEDNVAYMVMTFSLHLVSLHHNGFFWLYDLCYMILMNL